MLGEQVSGVVIPKYFSENKSLIPHSLLDPEALRVNVPQLAKSLSPTYPYGGAAVGPHLEG